MNHANDRHERQLKLSFFPLYKIILAFITIVIFSKFKRSFDDIKGHKYIEILGCQYCISNWELYRMMTMKHTVKH